MFFSPRPRRPLLLSVPALVLSAACFAPAHAQTPVSAAVATANKAELVNLVDEFVGNDIWPAKVVATFNFKLSASAWKAMLSTEGVETASRLGRNYNNYLKEQKIGDVQEIEESNISDRKSTQPEIAALLGKAKTKIGLSIEAPLAQLSPAQSHMFLTYLTYVGEFIDEEDWTPRGGRANLKLIVSSSAKDVAVTTSKDATNFTVVVPLKEASDWGGKIDKGLKRGGK